MDLSKFYKLFLNRPNLITNLKYIIQVLHFEKKTHT